MLVAVGKFCTVPYFVPYSTLYRTYFFAFGISDNVFTHEQFTRVLLFIPNDNKMPARSLLSNLLGRTYSTLSLKRSRLPVTTIGTALP